ncbi:MAG: PLP-dependent transferase [Candidatus Hodgkinia cicadicola]
MNSRLSYLNYIKKELNKKLSDSTLLIRAFDDLYDNFVNASCVGGSTVLFRNASEMMGNGLEYNYGTHGTPISKDLCSAINALECSESTELTPSGLMALTSTFLSILKPGDHALVVDSVYKPLRDFCNNILIRSNINIDYFDPRNEFSLKTLFRSNTRLVHLESPGSNTFEILDVKSICKYIKKRNSNCAISMDNSWATPLIFKPLLQGVDISIHALTKYPSGGSDIIMGSISTNKNFSKLLSNYQKYIGITGNDHDSYIVLKSLKSMMIRLKYHNDCVIKIYKYLNTVKCISGILCPFNKESPDYELWKRDYGLSNGVLSFVFENNSYETCKRFLNNLKIFGLGWSWGGYKSLASIVDINHRLFAPKFKGKIIRLQIGFENVNDLIWDLDMSFKKL